MAVVIKKLVTMRSVLNLLLGLCNDSAVPRANVHTRLHRVIQWAEGYLTPLKKVRKGRPILLRASSVPSNDVATLFFNF